MEYWHKQSYLTNNRALKIPRNNYLLAVLLAIALGLSAGWLFYGAWTGVISIGTLVTNLKAWATLAYLGAQGDTQVFANYGGEFLSEIKNLETRLSDTKRHPCPPSKNPKYAKPCPSQNSDSVKASNKNHRQSKDDATLAPKAILAKQMLTPESQKAAIEIKDLIYHYPQQEKLVINHLNLEIPAGQAIAIVGANGAGKSTLISLLAGLYTPTSGSISIAGMPAGIHSKNPVNLGVIFQDFTHYQLPIRDNIALGKTLTDEEIYELLTQAGAKDFLVASGHNLDTPLNPSFAGGTDLSGGQWQRIALARALAAVASGAQILVLDEPTSALDIRGESELFSRFLQLTQGITTILVTHRLSAIRNVDRIVVLGSGRIIEDGSHEELIAAQGYYAEMFNLQAKRFTQAGGQDA